MLIPSVSVLKLILQPVKPELLKRKDEMRTIKSTCLEALHKEEFLSPAVQTGGLFLYLLVFPLGL